MNDFLRDPIWQSIGVVVAVVFGFASLIVAIVTVQISRRRKSLGYGILPTTSLVTIHEEARDKVQLLFDNVPVTNVQLLRIFLANTGNVSIRKDDFLIPINLTFGSSTKILSATIARTSPAGLEKTTTISHAQRDVEIAPLHMNSEDWLEVSVLVTDFGGGVSVNGRVNGVKRIAELNANKLVLKTSRLLNLSTLLQAFSLISLITFVYVILITDLPILIRPFLFVILAFTTLLGLIVPDKARPTT